MAELGVQSCTLQGRLLGSSLKEVDRGRLGGDTPPPAFAQHRQPCCLKPFCALLPGLCSLPLGSPAEGRMTAQD